MTWSGTYLERSMTATMTIAMSSSCPSTGMKSGTMSIGKARYRTRSGGIIRTRRGRRGSVVRRFISRNRDFQEIRPIRDPRSLVLCEAILQTTKAPAEPAAIATRPTTRTTCHHSTCPAYAELIAFRVKTRLPESGFHQSRRRPIGSSSLPRKSTSASWDAPGNPGLVRDRAPGFGRCRLGRGQY